MGGLVDDVYCSIIYWCGRFGCVWYIISYEEEAPSAGGTRRFPGLAVVYHLQRMLGGVFFPTLAAAFGIDLYAEILARSCRSTSTSFFVTSVIPLIPGSALYYCMRSVVEGNLHQAWNYGRDTFLYALGIAAGMSIAWAICDFLRKIKGKQEIV